jgi:glycosyltransferase involved in cell wall biosynthesis
METAVLIPCFNEAATVGKVVADFRRALPDAVVYVYDNNSTDRTAECAAAAGAVVRRHGRQGKGDTVRRAFADVDADVYVLVDGDDTYDAAAAPALIGLLLREQCDFVNAARLAVADGAYRAGHRFGNGVLSGIIRAIFGRQLTDILSGYKVLSRRFVKTFPAASTGFEIETELAVHCLELNMPSAERRAVYRERPAGSVSKLRTVRDGVRILILIAHLIRNERPFAFFGLLAVVLLAVSLALGIPVVAQYLETGLVPRLPTAVLSASLAILAALSFMLGVMLQTVARMSRDLKRLAYLSLPARAFDAHGAVTDVNWTAASASHR